MSTASPPQAFQEAEGASGDDQGVGASTGLTAAVITGSSCRWVKVLSGL
ncbi:hypothetical protein AB0L83_32275 [Streptomyces sp. NPDC052071]